MIHRDDRFGITVEYLAKDDGAARASWNFGTDKKIGGSPKSGYIIDIDPFQAGWHSKNIHDWIRHVRPFKGHYGSGNVVQFWETGRTGEEEEIIEEVKNVIECGGPGDCFEKGRREIRARRAKIKAGKNPVIINEKSDAGLKRKYGISSQHGYKPTQKKDEKNKTHRESSGSKDAGTKKATKKRLVGAKNRDRTRKYAKLTIPIVCVAAIIGILVLGNGVIPFADITESFRSINVPCEESVSILISSGTTQGKIYLKKCNNVLTVSGNFNESAQVNLTLVSPDMKKTDLGTNVNKEFSTTIDKDLYDKQTGQWSISVTVNGDPNGILRFNQH